MKSARLKKVTKALQKSRNKDILSLEKRLNGNLEDVLGWFVERKSTNDIKELLKEKYDIQISRQTVWRFGRSKKWKSIIERGRIELAKHISKIPCANKEIRLLKYQKVIDEGFKWSLKTITKEGNEIFELKLNAVTEALKGAREEVEPHRVEHSGSITAYLHPETKEKSVEDLQQESIRLAEKIIANRAGTTISSKN